MQERTFGNTGLNVSILGFGGGWIGDGSIDEGVAETLFNRVLDAGITLIDTARMYGVSEERIGKYISHRRDEYVLSTKVGYDIPGHDDWTHSCVEAGVDRALKVMRTDRIDIVHLHTCGMDVLDRSEVIDALDRAREAGKIRVVAYSGDNQELNRAVASGRFASVQTSINVCDQRVVEGGLKSAQEGNLGVIAKRPVANAPWRFAERPVGHYGEPYWERWKAMNLDLGQDDEWHDVALRFTAFCPGVHTCIVGTTSVEHLEQNARILEKGPLPDDLVARLTDAFRTHDRDWVGQN